MIGVAGPGPAGEPGSDQPPPQGNGPLITALAAAMRAEPWRWRPVAQWARKARVRTRAVRYHLDVLESAGLVEQRLIVPVTGPSWRWRPDAPASPFDVLPLGVPPTHCHRCKGRLIVADSDGALVCTIEQLVIEVA